MKRIFSKQRIQRRLYRFYQKHGMHNFNHPFVTWYDTMQKACK